MFFIAPINRISFPWFLIAKPKGLSSFIVMYCGTSSGGGQPTSHSAIVTAEAFVPSSPTSITHCCFIWLMNAGKSVIYGKESSLSNISASPSLDNISLNDNVLLNLKRGIYSSTTLLNISSSQRYICESIQ